VKNRPKIIPISGGFLVDLTNSAWRILADFYIRSGGFEKNHLATLIEPQTLFLLVRCKKGIS
jgi:hypothetical protein